MPYVEYDEVEAICPDCGRIFRSEEALATHRSESHAGLEDSGEAPSAPDDVEVSCPTCHHVLASRAALAVHEREVHRPKKR
jgi:uncharacterized C2H2 Zn-finger protein